MTTVTGRRRRTQNNVSCLSQARVGRPGESAVTGSSPSRCRWRRPLPWGRFLSIFPFRPAGPGKSS
eukprot:3938745-Rhodomonas_salina.1